MDLFLPPRGLCLHDIKEGELLYVVGTVLHHLTNFTLPVYILKWTPHWLRHLDVGLAEQGKGMIVYPGGFPLPRRPISSHQKLAFTNLLLWLCQTEQFY